MYNGTFGPSRKLLSITKTNIGLVIDYIYLPRSHDHWNASNIPDTQRKREEKKEKKKYRDNRDFSVHLEQSSTCEKFQWENTRDEYKSKPGRISILNKCQVVNQNLCFWRFKLISLPTTVQLNKICVVSTIFNYSFNEVYFHLPRNSISNIWKIHRSFARFSLAHQSFPH